MRRERDYSEPSVLRELAKKVGFSEPSVLRELAFQARFEPQNPTLLHAKISFYSERYLRRERDSNPRYPLGVHTLSRRASSTTPAPLRYACKDQQGHSNPLIFRIL